MSTKKTKPKQAKPKSAEEYNAAKAGKLWQYSELPSHLADLRKRPTRFASAVRSFQRANGLSADSKLGPKTLAMIRTVYSSAPPAPEPKPVPGSDEGTETGDD